MVSFGCVIQRVSLCKILNLNSKFETLLSDQTIPDLRTYPSKETSTFITLILFSSRESRQISFISTSSTETSFRGLFTFYLKMKALSQLVDPMSGQC